MALAPNNKIMFIPPPTGGINAIAPYWNMPETDCVAMVNVAPKEGYSECRKGFELMGTSAVVVGVGNGFKMWTLNQSSGSSVILVHGNTLAKYVTTAGVWTDLGVLSDNLNFCQFRGRLFGAGGGATPRDFNGTVLGSPAWTGLTIANLESPWAYRGRLYFCEAGTRNVWYGGIDAITGALTSFPMESIMHLGGVCYFGGSSVPQEGRDNEAFWVCVSSMGEVIVYTGADPASSDWQFYGRYYLSPPLSRNSFFYIAGVLHIQTRTGIVSMSDILSSRKEGSNYVSISKKVDPILSSLFATFTSPQFYQIAVSPRENLLYVSVFVTDIGRAAYVMNLTTGAWSQYREPASYTMFSGFCTAGEDCYFISYPDIGSTTWNLWKVGQDYYYDKFGSGGSDRDAISWNIQSAFNGGSQNTNKKFNKVRPIVNNQITLTIGAFSDFETTRSSQAVTLSSGMNKKFYDLNKEAAFLSLYLAGASNNATTTALPQYFGSFISYEPGSNIP